MDKLILTLFIIALLAGILHIYDYITHDHEPTGVQYGDSVCIEGGGWFLGGMPAPQAFLVCGELQELETASLPPVEEERSLDNEFRS